MLTMTDSAAEAVRRISAGSGLEPEPGLRISVGQPTPEGPRLEFGLAAEAEPADQIVEEGDARIYLEEPVAEVLDAKVLDAQIDGDHIHFAFLDPPSGSNGNAPGA
jgi:iron-sulfur cluster assembly protein